MGMWDIPAKHEMNDTELRFNPYHDPTTGRFTTANGGGGGFLYVGKGQKGKGAYVFERDIDSEYNKWKAAKAKKSKNSINVVSKGTDIYNTTYATPEDYQKALSQKYNGITDVSKIKTAKDAADYINYSVQKGYYASTSENDTPKGYKHSFYDRPFKSQYNIAENGEASIKGYIGNNYARLSLPSNENKAVSSALNDLKEAGFGFLGDFGQKNMTIYPKKGMRNKKWVSDLQYLNINEIWKDD